MKCHIDVYSFFFLMIRRPPRSTLDRRRQRQMCIRDRHIYDAKKGEYIADLRAKMIEVASVAKLMNAKVFVEKLSDDELLDLSLIHISEPTRPY